MKKTLSLIVCLLSILYLLLNMDTLSDYLADFIESEKSFAISSNNEYTKNYDFKFIKTSEKFVPYSYQDLLDIIYSTLNNGWDTFTFYCPDEYSECLNDITKISKDTTLLSNINNFVHPFNNYSKIGIASSTTGEVTINITKLYSQKDIDKINVGVDEIITAELNNEMTIEDKILKVHDYIINNTRYDINKTTNASYTALGPLFNGTAVCSGYADLMAIFLTKFNLENFKIASDTHVWNAVYIDGTWLNIDLTWDDPITKDSDVDTLSHKFFMINKDKLLEFDTKDHKFDTTIYQELN